jgi:hypothetical protein
MVLVGTNSTIFLIGGKIGYIATSIKLPKDLTKALLTAIIVVIGIPAIHIYVIKLIYGHGSGIAS